MARSQQGDADAYRRLLTEIAPYLRSLACQQHLDDTEAEDAVQDILMTVHGARHTFDPARPFGPWLATIARRRIVDRIRRRSRLQDREETLNQRHETLPAPETNIVGRMADRQILRRALDELSPTQRRAVELLKLEEMSLKEASQQTGMSVAALKVATHRALKNLRTILTNRSDGT